MFIKLIFGLAWIGILCLGLAGIYLGIFPESLDMIDFSSYLVRGGISGVSLIYVLLFLEKIIILTEKPKELKIKTPNGILKISSNSINNIVKEAVGDYPKIKNVKVKNKNVRKKLKIFVSIDIISSHSLSEDLALIQQEIKNRIENYLDLSIVEVELRVTKLLQGN
ncbi:MAG: alkaline shock response membrane anchor protein AmaP [Psychrilyobacter sp.]|nr:alkaline shock response membrane anchor protein AmaP [Psychrilyobacter sp.]